MNWNKQTLLGLVLGSALFAFSFVSAQTTPSTLRSSTGILTRYTPDALTMTPSDSTTPLVYSYTKATLYLDENGNPAPVARIQPGIAVTVFYEMEENRMLARKVIVGKPAAAVPVSSGIVSIGTPGKTLNNQVGITPPKTNSTPAPAASTPVAAYHATSDGSVKGVVTWVTTNEIQIKTPEITQPVRVIYNAATSYADEKGNPLPGETVTTGQLVIVNYSRQGEAMVANNVTIRREVGANEPASMHRRSAPQGSGNTTTTRTDTGVFPFN